MSTIEEKKTCQKVEYLDSYDGFMVSIGDKMYKKHAALVEA